MNEMMNGYPSLLNDRRYFKPSKDARVLAILDSLAQDSGMSQSALGKRMRLSGAMVNQYLNELQTEKLVQFEAINGKRYRYILTKAGEEKRRSMFKTYSSETIQIYTALKNLIMEKLFGLESRGITKLALFGASETCEVVLSALRESRFEILTLLDNDPDKQGKLYHGYVVSPPDVLESIQCQAVLITSFGGQEEIYRQLLPISRRKDLEIVKL